jgi:glycosyltransferase involved in cell wall biosynthesis
MGPRATKTESRSITTPLVGIAIPCYNHAAFLLECLNSLIAQTETHWEAVVVDDCSSEDTIESIVASYRDPRLSYIRHEQNRGLAASRNTSLRNTKAPYLLCLDADDYLHPEFLEATLPMLHQQDYDCVFTDLQLVGISNEIWRYMVMTADEMAGAQWIPGAGTLMRRSLWERVGGYCEDNLLRVGNEDWDFWIGAMNLGISACHIPKPLYYYRRYRHSMSVSKLMFDDWKTREFIVSRHPQFFAKKDRIATFLSGGYLRSARTHFGSGHYGVSARLAQKAVAVNPAVLNQAFNALFSSVLRLPAKLSGWAN